MNKIINAAICDAREITEESLKGFDETTINAAVLIMGERSKELFNRYPVVMNVASVVEVPDGISFRSINGKYEIGPDADGKDLFLVVNGKLTLENDSLEAVKSYYRILVNGKVLMPKSFKGKLNNLTENGNVIYYPDGARILKTNAVIDDLFVSRASSNAYYCPGSMFFLHSEMDMGKLLEKGISFSADRIVVAESLLRSLVPQFDEDVEVIGVPDGTRLIAEDLDLKPITIKKYGTKLCVYGDVTIHDAEALSSLDFIYVDGSVSVDKDLEEAFERIDSICGEVKVIDSDIGYISDRATVVIGSSLLTKHPNGIRIEDCANVTLSKNLGPDEIMEKLQISDCAKVRCTKEQEEAVNAIAIDVARIQVLGQEDDSAGDGLFGDFMGNTKDTQRINASEYKM